MGKTKNGRDGHAGGADPAPDRDCLTDMYMELLRSVRVTGREIARLSGTRSQYISDIKRRQRPLSNEMYSRILAGLFGKYKWLMCGDFALDTAHIIALFPFIREPGDSCMALPVLQRPFVGPTMASGDWDGTFFQVAPPIREQAEAMHEPYILHLPFNDRTGRLRRGDYLLIDQRRTGALSHCLLVKSGWGVRLIRKNGDGYEDVENGAAVDEDFDIVGNVALILLGAI